MPSITINTQDPEIIAQLEEIKSKAQAKSKKSPARMERAKARKFATASRSVAKALCDVHAKFDTKMTGKQEQKNFVDLGEDGIFEVTIAVRRRTKQAIESAEGTDVASAFTDEVKDAVFTALKALDQKTSLTKQGFQEALAEVEGYEPGMWASLKDLLDKDPKSAKGRGTKFFPRAPKVSKKK